MDMMHHPYLESANPREAGHCACGRGPEEHPQHTQPIRRNLELERRMIKDATYGLCDPTELIDHAQMRAFHLSSEYVSDPLTIKPGINRPLQMREELTDLVNHALFNAQEHPEEIGSELWEEMRDVIGVAASLYDRLRHHDE
jgi:hypothetical protein